MECQSAEIKIFDGFNIFLNVVLEEKVLKLGENIMKKINPTALH